jgi:hypothetical protein
MTDRRRSGEIRAQARPAQARRIDDTYESDGPPGDERTGPRIGPTGILLAVALVGSLAYLLYAFAIVRDASQIPLLVSGAAVLGVVFVAIAVTGLIGSWRSSVSGRDGRALGHALVGGVACLAAAGCFAVASILGMVSQTR